MLPLELQRRGLDVSAWARGSGKGNGGSFKPDLAGWALSAELQGAQESRAALS